MNNDKKTALSLENFGDLLDADAQKITGASQSTWLRWKTGKSSPPQTAIKLLEMHANGRALPDAWVGFFFDATGRLMTPYAESIGPEDILAMFWYMQELRGLRGEMRRLTEKFDLVPKPDTPALKDD